jgi:phosphate starvation-inducible PhoH-like protein
MTAHRDILMSVPTDTPSAEYCLSFDDAAFANELFGPRNANLDFLARRGGLRISTRGGTVTLQGPAPAAALARELLMQLYALLKSGLRLHPRDVRHACAVLERDPETDLKSLYRDAVFASGTRRSVVARTPAQRGYVASLRDNDMTFAVGPAGTGKTYLAVAVALSMLTAKTVRRIILTRPAVEAGERLGFLPGDLAEKVNPYLRPLYDALHDMLDPEKTAEMTAAGTIEIAPLAFMRGRTLNDAFIILDEAQNTTPEQMKMFLTRLGFGAAMVVTGDVTQTDLPQGVSSGLRAVRQILDGIDGIGFCELTSADVVRHHLVSRIIEAWEAKWPPNSAPRGKVGP